VGLTIAVVGLVFIIFIGWRFLPERKAPVNAEELFQMQDYITEVKVTEESKVAGSSMRELDRLIEADFLVVGMIRKKKKHLAVSADEILQVNDVLIIEGDHQDLEKFISDGKLELVTGEVMDPSLLSSDKIALIEAVVPQGSRVEGRSSQSMRLRSRHHLNLVAIARQGNPFKNRLNHVNLRAGDVVMLQGNSESLKEDVLSLGFLPLIERGVQVGLPRKAFMPALIFLGAILLATFQVLPVQIAFATAVVVLIITNIVPVRKLYDTINWPVIILLGALIPVGQALNSSDATEIMTRFMQDLSLHISPVFMIALLFFVTMTLSDLMNNAATAVVMAPISVIMAQTLHAHVDPFLMTVAVAASCSFLTPIGHQNNTLVLGPGGYKFFDYLRMGIPLEIIIIIIAVPMILWIWPL
jgi:di/tricarboxylate transporter